MKPILAVTAALIGFVLAAAAAPSDDGQEVKFSDCPAPVRKTFQAEAKGAKVETVVKEKDEDGDTVFWADVSLGGRTYAIGVLADGTLSEMNLAVDGHEVPFDRSPEAVQKTFRAETFGAKLGVVGKDIKYGVTIYEAVVEHQGKSYEVVVAEDGTLVEKVLVIEDDDVDLASCPAAVRASLRDQSRGGKIGAVTRSSGIGRRTYEAEVEIKDKVYLIEVDEAGLLLSKSLEAGAE
jgi:hypothetical protein